MVPKKTKKNQQEKKNLFADSIGEEGYKKACC